MPTRRSSGGASTPVAVSSQTASPQLMRPRPGRRSPARARSVVVLPAPDGPASAAHRPDSTASDTVTPIGPASTSSARNIVLSEELDRDEQSGGHRHEHDRQRERG